MKKRGGIYHYVPHTDAAEWEAHGWVHAEDFLMPKKEGQSVYRWVGPGPVSIPYLDAERNKQLEDLDCIWPDPVGGDGE